MQNEGFELFIQILVSKKCWQGLLGLFGQLIFQLGTHVYDITYFCIFVSALKKIEADGNFRKRLFLFTSKTTWIRVSSITFVTALFLLIISHIVITVVTLFKEDGN